MSHMNDMSEQKPPSDTSSRSSYGQIMRASALLGGATSIGILLRIVRTKLFAIWLGPTGIGLIGVFDSLVTMATTVATLGTGASGVRQIAEASSTGDSKRIARSSLALRRITFVLALIGAATVAIFSPLLSELTFGTTQYRWEIAFLSIAVFLRVLSGGRAAIIQGMRRIVDTAKMRIIASFFGTLLGLALVLIWNDKGIIPYLVGLATIMLSNSWWFSRRIDIEKVEIDWQITISEAKALLGVGVAFFASGLTVSAAAYFSRMIVVRELGLEASGHFSAAFSLAGIYVGLIIGSMGTDFFPRLTEVAKNNYAVNRMVNEQIEFSMLLAVPGVFATLSFAPWVLSIFYSSNFGPAGEVLQWQVLGCLCRVIYWPMCTFLIVKGKRWTYLIIEVFVGILQVVLVIFGVRLFGLHGAGIAYSLALFSHLVLLLWSSYYFLGFQWSKKNVRHLLLITIVTPPLFLIVTIWDELRGAALGGAITAVTGLYCVRHILSNVPKSRLGRLRFLARWAKK